MAVGHPMVALAYVVAVAVAVSGTPVLVMVVIRDLLVPVLVVMVVNRPAPPAAVPMVPQSYMLRLRIAHMQVALVVRVEVVQGVSRLGPLVHITNAEV